MTIGIDLEQFIRDPYATGIQRVLQQLALHWPAEIPAEFVVPDDMGRYLLLTPEQAAAIDPAFMAATGLQASLTPSRANGFLNILGLMQAQARALVD